MLTGSDHSSSSIYQCLSWRCILRLMCKIELIPIPNLTIIVESLNSFEAKNHTENVRIEWHDEIDSMSVR